MGERSSVGQQYGDADGYDSYMGEWSTALAPLFLKFAAVVNRLRCSILAVERGTSSRSLSLLFPVRR